MENLNLDIWVFVVSVVLVPLLLPPIFRLWHEEFWLSVSELFRCVDSELLEHWLDLLNNVGVDGITVLLGSALDLDSLKETNSQSKVVDTAARTKGSFDDLWVWDNVVVMQLGESLSDLPSVDFWAIEVVDEVIVELISGPLLHDVVTVSGDWGGGGDGPDGLAAGDGQSGYSSGQRGHVT